MRSDIIFINVRKFTEFSNIYAKFLKKIKKVCKKKAYCFSES